MRQKRNAELQRANSRWRFTLSAPGRCLELRFKLSCELPVGTSSTYLGGGYRQYPHRLPEAHPRTRLAESPKYPEAPDSTNTSLSYGRHRFARLAFLGRVDYRDSLQFQHAIGADRQDGRDHDTGRPAGPAPRAVDAEQRWGKRLGQPEQ